MKQRSFALTYALRELKLRRRTFIPVICIAVGVMLLMTNLMVYTQCDYSTDLAYYKTDTHMIMPELTSTDIDMLKTLDFVESVDTVPDGSSFIAYVKIKDEYHKNYFTFAQCGVDAIEELRLQNRSPYSGYYKRYQDHGIDELSGCGLLNYTYTYYLRESPIFSPGMIFTIFLAFLMHLASITLVFNMKIRRSKAEFATMRAMGAGIRELRKINQIEAVGITLAMFFPALLVSLGTMKLVSVLSQNLYPGFGLNSVLMFDVPWAAIAISFILYLLAAYIAVFIVTRRLKTRTVCELISGRDEKIPYVEKSSVKLINSPNFKPYGSLYTRRTLRTFVPTQVLILALILFPMLLGGAVCGGFMTLFSSDSCEDSLLYSFESSYLNDQNLNIPRALVENMMSIDGVTRVEQKNLTNPFPYTMTTSLQNLTYDGLEVWDNFEMVSELFGDTVPELGKCIAPSELFSVGDKITVTLDGKSHTLEVSEVREGALKYTKVYNIKYYKAIITLSDETVADIMGWEEPQYSAIKVYCEKGREVELVPIVEKAAGYKTTYVNDYERQLRERTSVGYTGSATFLESRISDIYDAFLFSFLSTETLFLLICAGSVIASVTAFEVDGRKNELSVLRALGMDSDSLKKLAGNRQLIGIIIMVIAAFVIIFVTNVSIDYSQMHDPGYFIRLIPGTRIGIYSGVITSIKNQLLAYVPMTVLALIGYGLSSSVSAKKTVEKLLSRPIAENVKDKE